MFRFSFKLDRLLEWVKYFEELPKKTSAAVVKALNTAGEAVVREMARKISQSTGFSQEKARSFITVKKATESDKTFKIKQEVLPPSLDWSRPWEKPPSITDPDELVKIITQEDDKVCPICEDAASHNPYKMSDIAKMLSKWEHTSHPGLLHPNAVLEGSTFAAYGLVNEFVSSVFDGPAVKLTTSVGEITIGPNHPMFTRRGFVRAREINEGDELVYDLRSENPAVHSNFKQMPTIEDVFAAIVPISLATTIPSMSTYFHGDGIFCKGEVKIVWPTGELWPVFYPGCLEQFREFNFAGSDMELFFVPGLGSLEFGFYRNRLSSSCPVCGSSEGLSSFEGQAVPIPLQVSVVGSSVGRGDLGLSLFGGHTIPSLLSSPEFYPGFNQYSSCLTPAQTEFSGNGGDAISLRIECGHLTYMRVKRSQVVSFRGLAYDASTEHGIYNSSGFVVKNCRCTISAWSNMRRLAVQFAGQKVPDALMTVRQVAKTIVDEVKIVLRAKK